MLLYSGSGITEYASVGSTLNDASYRSKTSVIDAVGEDKYLRIDISNYVLIKHINLSVNKSIVLPQVNGQGPFPIKSFTSIDGTVSTGNKRLARYQSK